MSTNRPASRFAVGARRPAGTPAVQTGTLGGAVAVTVGSSGVSNAGLLKPTPTHVPTNHPACSNPAQA